MKINMLAATALVTALSSSAFGQDAKAAIQQKLESEYALTQPTADDSDIVTAGAVLVLQRGKGANDIIMAPVTSTNFYQNTYKDGRITQNALGKSKKWLDRMNHMPGMSAPAAPDTRTFVPGEKMWLTKVEVKDDGVVFDLFTDAFSDVRYKASLKFAFAKGSVPTVDQVDQTVAEVFKVQPSDDTNANGQPQQAPAKGQPAGSANVVPVSAPAVQQSSAAPPAPIPPPPAPIDAPAAPPKSMSKGQTTDQVVANFGPPEKIIKLGAKQIYVYKDVKVTFVGGKLTDVQ